MGVLPACLPVVWVWWVVQEETLVVFVVSTFTDGKPPEVRQPASQPNTDTRAGSLVVGWW